MIPLTEPPTQTAQATAPQWITDDSLFHYQRCARRAYLDLYGDRAMMDPPSDYLQKIQQDSAEHRAAVLEDYVPLQRPIYAHGDWHAAAQATIALMASGADHIVGGVLVTPITETCFLVSRPDLLIKQGGWSIWGSWQYAPVDIKLGKKPKLDYQIVAAFHAEVLAAVQGTPPHESWLALRDDRYHSVDLAQQLPKMREILTACLRDLTYPEPPEVFIAHSRCDLCHWFTQCYGEARQTQHISLLPGVTSARYTHLQALGLTTVRALAATPSAQLANFPGFGEAVAEKLVHQAQATLYNRAIARTEPTHNTFVLPPDALPSAEVELYFDIEAAPDFDLIYLHGVLVVDHRHQTQRFHALLAEHVDQERQAWESFLELVLDYPHAPIYHFCPYEAQTVRKLTHQYSSLNLTDLHRLLSRFVDIHDRVTTAVTLPVESYALKHIARWMGFDWRDHEANGAQSICWYNDWLMTGDRAYLEAILRYNEDDCHATYHVKRWLTEFADPLWSAPAASLKVSG